MMEPKTRIDNISKASDMEINIHILSIKRGFP
jgi:hypothetical protein